MITEVPPGSPEAVKRGCICPVIDNHHGRGCRDDGKRYITNPGCRLHHSRDRLGEALPHETSDFESHPICVREMQPTFATVDVEVLRRALEAVELGLEHTRTSLAEYDDAHGRTILRHRQWCETLEQHASKLLRCREELKSKLGIHK